MNLKQAGAAMIVDELLEKANAGLPPTKFPIVCEVPGNLIDACYARLDERLEDMEPEVRRRLYSFVEVAEP